MCAFGNGLSVCRRSSTNRCLVFAALRPAGYTTTTTKKQKQTHQSRAGVDPTTPHRTGEPLDTNRHTTPGSLTVLQGETEATHSSDRGSKVVQLHLFPSTQPVKGRGLDEQDRTVTRRLRGSSGDSHTEKEVFIYMRLSLLHSASDTIVPAASLWTNDSERGSRHRGWRGCGFRTDGLKRDTTGVWGRAFRFPLE